MSEHYQIVRKERKLEVYIKKQLKTAMCYKIEEKVLTFFEECNESNNYNIDLSCVLREESISSRELVGVLKDLINVVFGHELGSGILLFTYSSDENSKVSEKSIDSLIGIIIHDLILHNKMHDSASMDLAVDIYINTLDKELFEKCGYSYLLDVTKNYKDNLNAIIGMPTSKDDVVNFLNGVLKDCPEYISTYGFKEKYCAIANALRKLDKAKLLESSVLEAVDISNTKFKVKQIGSVAIVDTGETKTMYSARISGEYLILEKEGYTTLKYRRSVM